jgi:AraC-like DNA-binding protein
MSTSRSSESVRYSRFAPADGSASSQTIARILDSARFIETHLESRVGVADMAEAACYSLFHYCRSFNRLTRMSPYDYFIRRKLTVAADLLETTRPGVTDLAFRFGFETPEGFSRAFRRMFAILPSQVLSGTPVDRRLLLAPLSESVIGLTSRCLLSGPERRSGATTLRVNTADLDSLDSPGTPLFAAGKPGTGAVGGKTWFGVHYAASRLTAFAGIESRDAASCPTDHPFRIDLPAGDYLAVDCLDGDGDIASLFRLTFSTFYPATRNPELPATAFAVRSSDRLRILVPAPSCSGESSAP